MTLNVFTAIQSSVKRLSCRSPDRTTGDGEHKLRNWIGFWMLGLSNHFAFFMMLAAAHDLLTEPGPRSDRATCNPLSTGALLIADTIPALMGIVLSPFVFKNTTARIVITMALSLTSFNMAGLSSSYVTVFAGVISGSLACGFGEASILAYATRFHKDIVSGWSSGTGASSVVASAVYLLLTIILPPKPILLIMNIVPLIMAVAYFIVLVHPAPQSLKQVTAVPVLEEVSVTETKTPDFAKRLKSHLIVVRHGLWYAIPIFVTTFAMFFINQGLFELLFFRGTSFDQDMQYRLYATLSAIGVFMSRSSVQIIHIDKLWIFPIAQVCILVVVLSHVMEPFLQYIYVVMVLVFLGGIFGGATYVNTFYKINNVCEELEKPTITAMSLIGNELAAAVAGFVAVPAHDALCALISEKGM